MRHRRSRLPFPRRGAALVGALSLGLGAAACANDVAAEGPDAVGSESAAVEGAERPEWRGHHGHPDHDGPGIARMMDELELTEDQRARVDQILEAHRDRMAGPRDAMRAERRATRDALMAVLTPEQREALDSIRAARQARSIDHRVEAMSEHLALTGEQAADVRSLLVAAHERRDAIREDDALDPEQRHAEMEAIRDETHAAIGEVLDPEQRAKADAWRERHQGRHGHPGRRGHGHGRRGPPPADDAPPPVE